MKILVTGGAGFIASHIVDAYIHLGHKVVVIDNLSTGIKKNINPQVVFYLEDITNKDEIEKIIFEEKPDIINHHAAQMSIPVSVANPVFDVQTNIIGLINVLEAGRKVNVKKVIFASSAGAIYGEATDIPTSENYQPQKPLSPYGISKLSGELYLHYYFRMYKIPYIVLRYSNVYGPRQNAEGEAGVVAIFINKMIHNQNPVIFGSGFQTRDFIYVDDIVKANCNCIHYEKSDTFNIATGIESDMHVLLHKIKEIEKSDIKPISGRARAGDQQRSCLNIAYAKTNLNWIPDTLLQDGLTKTIAYYKSYETSKT